MPMLLNYVGRASAVNLVRANAIEPTAQLTMSAAEINALTQGEDWFSVGKQFLAVDSDVPNDSANHWKYQFAKGGKIYRAAITDIRQKAQRDNQPHIVEACVAILNEIDGKVGNKPSNIIKLPTAKAQGTPAGYKMVAKDKKGEIYLYGDIGASFWSVGVTADQFSKDLRALGDVTTIDIRINSDGGDVFEGRTIYSLLKEHKARIVVKVDGLAASIASLIAMAGDEIVMAGGTFMMIHNAWGLAVGDAAEMRRIADLLDSVNGTLIDTYAARSKNERNQIKKWMNEETWMTADVALERGFANTVTEPVAVAASLSKPNVFPNLFKQLPSALRPNRAAVTSKINSLLKERSKT